MLIHVQICSSGLQIPKMHLELGMKLIDLQINRTSYHKSQPGMFSRIFKFGNFLQAAIIILWKCQSINIKN